MEFRISSEIFQLFPGIQVVVALAMGVGAADHADEIDRLLHGAWALAGEAALAHGNAQSHPNIKPWGERMKAAGAPRKQFPSSIEALVRRAGKGGEPVSIGPVVDFYNAISLTHLVPAGGFDIDDLRGDLCLRLSREGDRFLALDSEEELQLPPGEVSYADGSTVITRHFVWKQARHTLLKPESRNIFFVSEILGELPAGTAQTVCDAFADGLLRFFGITAPTAILSEQQTAFEIGAPAQ